MFIKIISNLQQQNILTITHESQGKPIMHTLHVKRTKNKIPKSRF